MDSKANGHNCKLYQHMRKLGQFEFEIELLEEFECDTRKEILEKEQHYMDQVPAERLLNQRRAVKKVSRI